MAVDLRRAAFSLAIALGPAMAFLAGGCARELVGTPPPLDRPHFPTGLALHPERPLLAVVSSNFDLEFNRGALLLADLEAIDAAIGDSGGIVRLSGEASPYAAGALIPSFGNEPVFIDEGRRMLLASREQNLVSEIPLSLADGIGFACEASPDPESDAPLCGQGAASLQVPGNDPFELALVSESETSAIVMLGLLSSPDVLYVEERFEVEGAGRLRLLTGPSFSLEGYTELGEPRGVRGLAIRPESGGAATTAFLTVERTSVGRTTNAVDLVWFDASQGEGARLRALPLTEDIGAIDARGVVVHPDGSAVFVLLRNPDAILRVDLFVEGGELEARLGGVVSTCYDPIDLVVGLIPTPEGDAANRLFVSCFDNDTLLAYDPLSLVEKGALRGFGDGPYGLALDTTHEPPRLYVSFFEDDTVGVIDLLAADGEVALVPRALIGAPRNAEQP